MKSQIVFIACFFLAVAFGVGTARKSEENVEYPSEFEHDTPSVDDETSKSGEEAGPELTTALADAVDHASAKDQGFCHWAINTWYRPGFVNRCNCMKCTCLKGGKWDCAFNFAYCPFFFCGNGIYNPSTHTCCCGKLYAKKSSWSCCGYFFYNTATSKCCDYFTVKAKNLSCPRSKV